MAPIPATGSLDGDLAAARQRQRPKTSRRTRKAYRITDRGDARFEELLLADDAARRRAHLRAEARVLRHLEPAARVELLERRRAVLADGLAHARRSGLGRGDRYARSLFEHRTQSTQRDLEWIEALIAAEAARRRRQPNNRTAHRQGKGATAS